VTVGRGRGAMEQRAQNPSSQLCASCYTRAAANVRQASPNAGCSACGNSMHEATVPVTSAQLFDDARSTIFDCLTRRRGRSTAFGLKATSVNFPSAVFRSLAVGVKVPPTSNRPDCFQSRLVLTSQEEIGSLVRFQQFDSARARGAAVVTARGDVLVVCPPVLLTHRETMATQPGARGRRGGRGSARGTRPSQKLHVKFNVVQVEKDGEARFPRDYPDRRGDWGISTCWAGGGTSKNDRVPFEVHSRVGVDALRHAEDLSQKVFRSVISGSTRKAWREKLLSLPTGAAAAAPEPAPRQASRVEPPPKNLPQQQRKNLTL